MSVILSIHLRKIFISSVERNDFNIQEIKVRLMQRLVTILIVIILSLNTCSEIGIAFEHEIIEPSLFTAKSAVKQLRIK